MARKKIAEQSERSVSTGGENGAGGVAVASTKSQAIRDAYARLGPRTRPRDVIADLKSQGIAVSSAQVSMVRKSMGIRKRRRRAGTVERTAPTTRTAEGSVSVSDLIAAKQLADQMGGVKVVRKALETLERLR
jgi:hypothetical protein